MTQLFTNNGTGTLASGITNVATSMTLNGGDGALFPAITVPGDFFYATLYQIVAGVETNWEIVKVTARATDTLTIVRGQQGTTPRAFSTGDPVQLRWTKGDADTSMITVPVRQTVLAGAVSAGLPAFFAAGSGLALNLTATAVALQIAFAAGFNADGNTDYVSQLTADVAGFVSSLPANNTSYISATYVDPNTVTWNKTLLPPQYGYAYDRTLQSLLRFPGTDASTTFLDDYGNTWTAVADAQIDTAVQIDGLNTLLLDGTGDYAESTSFTSLGGGSWTMECKVRWNTLPSGANQTIFTAVNAGNFGLLLMLNDTAGTKKLSFSLSSTGSTENLANAVLGTSTTWAAATTYHIAVVYDALAGKYFVYKDGVAEAALTVTSALRASSITRIRLGMTGGATAPLNGAIAGFRLSPCCRYPNGTTFTAPNISTFAVEGDYFSIAAMQMYGVTAASTSAGTDPTLTAMNEVYVGEADTSGAAVTAVRNYAYQGRAQVDTATLAVSNNFSVAHNLGVRPGQWALSFVAVVINSGYLLGEEVHIYSAYFDGTLDSRLVGFLDPLNALISTRATGISFIALAGGVVTMTYSSWKARWRLSRGW